MENKSFEIGFKIRIKKVNKTGVNCIIINPNDWTSGLSYKDAVLHKNPKLSEKTRVLKVKDVKFIKFNKTMRKIVNTDNGFIFRFDNQSRYEKTLDIGNKLFWNV